MTEGSVTTRFKALEKALSKVTQDLQGLTTTIQGQAEELSRTSKTIEWLQKSHEALVSSLVRIEKTNCFFFTHSFAAHTIKSLSFTHYHKHNPHSRNYAAAITHRIKEHSGGVPVRLPKLEIPFFSGENVTGWLFQVERFFLFHNTPQEQKLTVAAFYMSGEALQWYQWLHATHQLTTWEQFSMDLENHFGPSHYVNHEALLFKIQQHHSVIEYRSRFETLSTRTRGLTPTNLLNCFISSLKEHIRKELYLLKRTTLGEAINMAQLVEDKSVPQ